MKDNPNQKPKSFEEEIKDIVFAYGLSLTRDRIIRELLKEAHNASLERIRSKADACSYQLGYIDDQGNLKDYISLEALDQILDQEMEGENG